MTKLDVYKATEDKTETQPALRVGVNTAAVAGILSLIATLYPGLLSDRLTTIILVISAFVLPVITALIARNKVWAISSVAEVVNESIKEATEIANQKARRSGRGKTY